MYTPFKMKGKSPMMKKLIGKQGNLPEHLKAKIEAAPESPTKMMKKSPTKMAKKSPTKKINPFSAEYKRMTVNQRKKKYGDDYKTKIKGGGKKDLTVANVKESLGNLNKKIKTGADKVSNVISPKDASGKPQKKKITTKGGKIKVENKSGGGGNGGNGGNSGGGNSSGFSGMKGGDAKYTYKLNSDGSYTGKNSDKPGKTFTIKEGDAGFDKLNDSGLKMKKSAMKMKKAPTKMKKKSSMKMMKKSPSKMMKKSKKS